MPTHLDIGNYTKRIVRLIGDPASITDSYFQNWALLYNMFFRGTAHIAQCGYSWHLSEICASICSEIELLTYKFYRDEYDKFEKMDVRGIAYEALTEDHLPATATKCGPICRMHLPIISGSKDRRSLAALHLR